MSTRTGSNRARVYCFAQAALQPALMFLNADELRELTGYKTAARQIQWLRSHGIVFYVNALGRPVVPKDAIYRSSNEPKLGVVR